MVIRDITLIKPGQGLAFKGVLDSYTGLSFHK
jgi:hypothetical protein